MKNPFRKLAYNKLLKQKSLSESDVSGESAIERHWSKQCSKFIYTCFFTFSHFWSTVEFIIKDFADTLTSTDIAGDSVLQRTRTPGIEMSQTNNTSRGIPSSLIPMTEEDKRKLEEVIFNQQLRSVGLDFLKMC